MAPFPVPCCAPPPAEARVSVVTACTGELQEGRCPVIRRLGWRWSVLLTGPGAWGGRRRDLWASTFVGPGRATDRLPEGVHLMGPNGAGREVVAVVCLHVHSARGSAGPVCRLRLAVVTRIDRPEGWGEHWKLSQGWLGLSPALSLRRSSLESQWVLRRHDVRENSLPWRLTELFSLFPRKM